MYVLLEVKNPKTKMIDRFSVESARDISFELKKEGLAIKAKGLLSPLYLFPISFKNLKGFEPINILKNFKDDFKKSLVGFVRIYNARDRFYHYCWKEEKRCFSAHSKEFELELKRKMSEKFALDLNKFSPRNIASDNNEKSM